MGWVILLVLVLAVVWWLSRHRAVSIPPPTPTRDPRRRLAMQLVESAGEARREGRHGAAQALALKATWLRLEPPLGRDDPPSELNPNDGRHLRLVDEIRMGYGAFLAAGTERFAGCRYRPAELLPYPKRVIAEALGLVLDLAAGRARSVHVEPGTLSSDMIATVEGSLRLLDDFVDLPVDELPADPAANEAAGRRATESGS